MRLKAEHVYEAMLVISQIIRDQRPMPLRGKFLLARMHSQLLSDFNVIAMQHDDTVRVCGVRRKIPDPTFNGFKIDPMSQSVPMIDGPDFIILPECRAAWEVLWRPIADELIDVNVQPIPIGALSLGDGVDGTIQANELSILGELITE